MRIYSFITYTTLLGVLTQQAHAGAWTQPSGKGLVILNGVYYSADKLRNNQGNKRSQATYSKYELNPYLEYGINDAWTVGTNLSLQRAHQDGTPAQSNWGLGDSEFFVRARLWQHEGFTLSAEPMIKLPSPEGSRETPKLGGEHMDAGLGLSLGYGFGNGGLNHFINIDTGYRYRFDDPEDQIKLSGTLGYSISPEWMVMPQIFATYRVGSPTVVAFTQSSGDDYNLVKLQLSAVYKMNEDVSLQVGGFTDIDGKNVGAGNGLLLSVWKHF